jgi:hypothetical protein
MSSGEQEALRLAKGLRDGTLLLSERDEAAECLERLHAEREEDRALMREALEALAVGNEAAQAIALDMRIAYAGYMSRRQKEADDDVEKISAAISKLRERVG